jgi:hypothetical protein
MLQLSGAWLCDLSSVPQGSALAGLRSSVFKMQRYLLQVDTCQAFLVVTNPRWLTSPKYDGGTDPVSQQTMASSHRTLVHTPMYGTLL